MRLALWAKAVLVSVLVATALCGRAPSGSKKKKATKRASVSSDAGCEDNDKEVEATVEHELFIGTTITPYHDKSERPRAALPCPLLCPCILALRALGCRRRRAL